MSIFSEKLAQLIADSGLNISQISRLTGIERTKILRQKNGNGHITEKELEKILSLMQLSREEEEQMLELYQLERVGRDKFETRKAVEELADCIGKMRRNWTRMQEFDDSPSKMLFWPADGETKTALITEDMVIADAIYYAICKEVRENETADIRMDMFGGCEEVMRYLIRLEHWSNHRINCVQYVSFMKNNSSGAGVHNLGILKNIIPFVFTYHNNYQVKYTYISSSDNNSVRLLPHFLLTQSCVLLFSEKADRLLFIEDEQIADLYRKECLENEKKYRNLLKSVDEGVESVISYYSKNVFVHGPKYILESNPCVIFMLYSELIDSEKDNLYFQQLYQHVMMVFEKEKAPCMDYFGWTAEMDGFLKTGRLPGVYGQYSRAYTPSERKKMLEHFIAYFDEQENKNACLLKKFRLEEGINIELYPDNKLSFQSVSDKYLLCIATLDENGICEIFRDYLDSLKDSRAVYTFEETKAFLLKKIDEISRDE